MTQIGKKFLNKKFLHKMHILEKTRKIYDKMITIFIFYSILNPSCIFQVGFHQADQEKWVSWQKEKSLKVKE